MSDNLHALRRRETDHSSDPKSKPPKKKSRMPSLARSLPWLLLAAFILLIFWLFGDRFDRGREVDLIKVITVRAQDLADTTQNVRISAVSVDALSYEGATLFQASGWIEPDPLLVRATTLYSGVVETVDVLEGERVEKGQLLATMVAEDAELDLQTAKAHFANAEAEVASAMAELEATKAMVESKRREVVAGEARLNELVDESDRLKQGGKEVFRESRIVQSALQVESQVALVDASRAKVKEAEAQLIKSHSAIEQSKANLARAKAELGRRQLRMSRTRIISPIDGRIQKLYAAPGKKRMLEMDDPESATIATLFDPEKLQARIDVPLEEAAQLVIGQLVRLRSSLLPDRVFKGRVSRIDGEADLQRNTLQAKVQILDPVDKLRPEMLCRAEFLPLSGSDQRSNASSLESSGRLAFYIPESAVVRSGQSASAWVVDASGERIESRELHLGDERRDGHVRVLEGLRPGDWIVDKPAGDLSPGERVRNIER
jgi:RND family efflux transporter MFP subunit